MNTLARFRAWFVDRGWLHLVGISLFTVNAWVASPLSDGRRVASAFLALVLVGWGSFSLGWRELR